MVSVTKETRVVRVFKKVTAPDVQREEVKKKPGGEDDPPGLGRQDI